MGIKMMLIGIADVVFGYCQILGYRNFSMEKVCFLGTAITIIGFFLPQIVKIISGKSQKNRHSAMLNIKLILLGLLFFIHARFQIALPTTADRFPAQYYASIAVTAISVLIMIAGFVSEYDVEELDD